MRRTLVRIAHEIVEKNPAGAIALVGIHRRGAYLAKRLQPLISELLDPAVPLRSAGSAVYRHALNTPHTHPTTSTSGKAAPPSIPPSCPSPSTAGRSSSSTTSCTPVARSGP